MPVDDKYEAYVSKDNKNVEIKATTIDETNLVRIVGFEAETNITKRKVDFNATETKYVIEVIDAKNSANKKQYEFEENMFKEHISNIAKTSDLRILLRYQLNEQSEYSLETALKLIELYSNERWEICGENKT